MGERQGTRVDSSFFQPQQLNTYCPHCPRLAREGGGKFSNKSSVEFEVFIRHWSGDVTPAVKLDMQV